VLGNIQDETVLAAAILHDTIEDTDTTEQELTTLFGQEITSIVKEVTDDKTLPKLERKAKQIEKAPKMSRQACLIKLADKISNIEDVISNPVVGWDLDRRRVYRTWATSVVSRLTEKPKALIAHFDNLIIKAEGELV